VFFESTLGLQASFEPAAVRLINIYCLQLLSKTKALEAIEASLAMEEAKLKTNDAL